MYTKDKHQFSAGFNGTTIPGNPLHPEYIAGQHAKQHQDAIAAAPSSIKNVDFGKQRSASPGWEKGEMRTLIQNIANDDVVDTDGLIKDERRYIQAIEKLDAEIRSRKIALNADAQEKETKERARFVLALADVRARRAKRREEAFKTEFAVLKKKEDFYKRTIELDDEMFRLNCRQMSAASKKNISKIETEPYICFMTF